MKNFCLFLLTALLIVSCETETKREGYLITGNAPGVYDGIRAYLKVQNARGRQVNVDTAIVAGGKFVFDGKIENPNMHFITVDNVPGSLQVMFENGEELTIDIDKQNIIKSTILGSPTNEKYTAFNESLMEGRKEVQKLNTELRKAHYGKDSMKVEELKLVIEEKSKNLENIGFKFIKENPSSTISLVLLELQTRNRNLDTDKFLEHFNYLSDDLKSSPKAKDMKSKVDIMVQKLKREENLKVGKLAPTFSAPDQNGNTLALNDVKGKITLIDFWASWCGPCRRENPNVVRIYDKYKDKGLEIVGVSLDRPGQKAKWLKAIEDDKLSWKHVSNLQYFADPVAQMYNVSSIPATYIIDAEGKIVAKNLRGAALELKIEELLN